MNPVPVLLTDVRIPSAAASAQFGNAQGNILKGHGRTHSTFLFVEFSDLTKAKGWLQQLLDTAPGQGGIISTAQQLADREAFNATGKDAGPFVSLLFTALGIAFFQQPLPAEAADQVPGENHLSKAFAEGMRDIASRELLDPAPADWDEGWFDKQGNPTPIHALLLLASDSYVKLAPVIAAAKAALNIAGAVLHVEEQGTRLVVAGHDIEHFGYADGVSQPLYLTDDAGTAPPHLRDLALKAEELVFLPDPLCPAQADAWGSFMVFRKLQQDVKAFNKEEDEILVDALQLQDPDTENTKSFAGAMVVGRFENGTPLALHGTRQDNDGNPGFTNDFTYDGDKEGLKCPFHAHIRKVNPRGETGSPGELHHRITRRGVPYGTRAAAVKEHPTPVGLLFTCYQRNIEQQFEFLQKSWANNPGFLHPQVQDGSDTGLDPVIGQGPRRELTFPTAWGWPTTAQASFDQHVTLKGGEYFYAPSLCGLAELAKQLPLPHLAERTTSIS